MTKEGVRDIIERVYLYFYTKSMFDTKKATKEFVKLAHPQKLEKIQEILHLMAKKSPFFADLQKHFTKQKDIQDNALDAMYDIVMNVAQQQSK